MTLPKWDLVGPTVDDDIRRIIQRYGAEAAVEAIERQTRRKPGMPTKGDWKVLHKIVQEDARLWLAGGNPFMRGADHSVATWFAEAHPDENVQSSSTYKIIIHLQACLSKAQKPPALLHVRRSFLAE
jgi:hypothetical protein